MGGGGFASSPTAELGRARPPPRGWWGDGDLEAEGEEGKAASRRARVRFQGRSAPGLGRW